MAEQIALSFGALLRLLRDEALLTQEELAEAARLSPRSVSDLERGINRTARKETAELLAGALGLAEPVRGLFVAAALGRRPAGDVLAARADGVPDPGHRDALSARDCPYRGLLPFGEADAEVFYGREQLAAELAAKVAARAAAGGLVVVTGASGSGKSSLLRAGLLPVLAQGQRLPGSQRWPRIVMTPTKDPLTELAAQLAAVGGPDALAVRDQLARHPEQAHLSIRSAVLAATARHGAEPPGAGDGSARLVLIVDQFEQVFTLNPGPSAEDAGHAFITALCAAAANPAGPRQEPAALVVIAVRGDFWDRCAAVPELVGALQDGQFVVGPMTESGLRVAITGPAEAAGLRIDPGLTETILEDLRVAGGDRSAGVLPLLSQAMALTWEQREGDRLTSHGYAVTGGVSHAVQTAADRAYDALPASQRAIARQVLHSMTVADRDGGLARRPVTREDLYTGRPAAERADIDAVLDAFTSERLAILDGDTAQLSHDVILRAWPRLRDWLAEDQASWLLHGQLADASAAWLDGGEDPSFLYQGARLAALQQALTRWSASPARYPALTGTQRQFLRASERAAARSVRLRRGGIAALTLVTAVAVAVAAFAIDQRVAVTQQSDLAVANRLTIEAAEFAAIDPPLAAQLALAAYRIDQAPDDSGRLLHSESTPLSAPIVVGSAPVTAVAFSPDGHTLTTVGGSPGAVRSWNVTNLARPRPLGRPVTGNSTSESIATATSVAFSPDGRTLATTSANGSQGAVQLWGVTDPAHLRSLSRLSAGNRVDSVAFSPDGQTLATGNGDGTISLWNLTRPADAPTVIRPASPNAGPVWSVAFSPVGTMLAAGSDDGAIQLWNITRPADPSQLGSPVNAGGGPVSALTFSADGRELASVGPGGIGLWDAADAPRLVPLAAPLTSSATTVEAVAFSPDGSTLAAGYGDGTIRLWNLPPAILTGSAPVEAMALSRDGRTLAVGSGDGTISLWNTADPAHARQLGRIASPTQAIWSVDISPDGHTLAVSSVTDDAIWLWNITDPAHPSPSARLPNGEGLTWDSVAFSPDGHTLATGSDDGAIWLWNAAVLAHPRLLGQARTGPSPGGASAVTSMAFSPDGKTLAAAGEDGAIRLWNVTAPAQPRPLTLALQAGSSPVHSVAFSPDGRTLASVAGEDGIVRLWAVASPASPRMLAQLPATGNFVTSVAFSPDSTTLVTGAVDNGYWIWEVADPVLADAGRLSDSAGSIWSVAFTPDGTLASGDAAGTILFWNMNVQDAIDRVCAAAGGLTPQQWHQDIPGLSYQATCP